MLLEAKQMDFGYDSRRRIIHGVSLGLEHGSMTAVIGANGCGKSTLVRLLAGMLRPQHGSVLYRGVPLFERNRRELAKELAYVPQSLAGTFPFTSLEVVLTGRTPHASPFRLENAQDVERAMEALEIIGMPHLAARRITEISGGERQLVSVARALAQEPKCLLLDEPSASLDLKHRASLIRVLGELRRRSGLTVLMVTHDLNLLDPGFDRVFAMRCGQIDASGPPHEVLREHVLAEIYDDPYIRTRRVEGRLCVWSEVHP